MREIRKVSICRGEDRAPLELAHQLAPVELLDRADERGRSIRFTETTSVSIPTGPRG